MASAPFGHFRESDLHLCPNLASFLFGKTVLSAFIKLNSNRPGNERLLKVLENFSRTPLEGERPKRMNQKAQMCTRAPDL